MANITKSPERQRVLDVVEQYERQGLFHQDVEQDEIAKQILPHQIDYTKSKLTSKVKTWFANIVATRFYEGLISKHQLIIDDVVGLDNFTNVEGGKVLTCNHFSVCDNYAIMRPIRKYIKGKALYKVTKEGNYTSYKGLFGFFFRHCNTLPLASRTDTMKKFLQGCHQLLSTGHTVLIYPEQAMWWNYRKPRPLKNGAFRIASRSNVPLIPGFITMRDSDIIGSDGYPIQRYTLHYMPAIYPKPEYTEKQNCQYLMEQNYLAWVQVYESTYGIPLEYATEDK